MRCCEVIWSQIFRDHRWSYEEKEGVAVYLTCEAKATDGVKPDVTPMPNSYKRCFYPGERFYLYNTQINKEDNEN